MFMIYVYALTEMIHQMYASMHYWPIVVILGILNYAFYTFIYFLQQHTQSYFIPKIIVMFKKHILKCMSKQLNNRHP